MDYATVDRDGDFVIAPSSLKFLSMYTTFNLSEDTGLVDGVKVWGSQKLLYANVCE